MFVFLGSEKMNENKSSVSSASKPHDNMQNVQICWDMESQSQQPLPPVARDGSAGAFWKLRMCFFYTVWPLKPNECNIHSILLHLITKSSRSPLLSHTSRSVCSTPKLSGGILSSPGTSCACTEPDKMPCKHNLLHDKAWLVVRNDHLGPIVDNKKGSKSEKRMLVLSPKYGDYGATILVIFRQFYEYLSFALTANTCLLNCNPDNVN